VAGEEEEARVSGACVRRVHPDLVITRGVCLAAMRNSRDSALFTTPNSAYSCSAQLLVLAFRERVPSVLQRSGLTKPQSRKPLQSTSQIVPPLKVRCIRERDSQPLSMLFCVFWWFICRPYDHLDGVSSCCAQKTHPLVYRLSPFVTRPR
jgi:hypothetical protein